MLFHCHLCVVSFSDDLRFTEKRTGNILILRDKIQILPYERTSVSYDYLSQLVAEYLLLTCPDVDISAALSVMPATRSSCISPKASYPADVASRGSGPEPALYWIHLVPPGWRWRRTQTIRAGRHQAGARLARGPLKS